MFSADAPAHLPPAQVELWNRLVEQYELNATELELLERALGALGRADAARAAIEEHGVLVRDRFGALKANPGVRVEIDNTALGTRLLRALKLPDPNGRPHAPSFARAIAPDRKR